MSYSSLNKYNFSQILTEE